MPGSKGRSGCPINLAVEILGDSWSLVVLRDVIFGNRRHFHDLHRSSEEGIATNILASRLRELVEAGLLTKHDDPTHKQRATYNLTEAAIQLVPVMVLMGDWGARWTPADDALAARARALADGGPKLWAQFMDELRAEHLDADRVTATAESIPEQDPAADPAARGIPMT